MTLDGWSGVRRVPVAEQRRKLGMPHGRQICDVCVPLATIKLE
jgi:hypothetical protein